MIYMYMYIYTYMYMSINRNMYTCTYVYIWIYIYIYVGMYKEPVISEHSAVKRMRRSGVRSGVARCLASKRLQQTPSESRSTNTAGGGSSQNNNSTASNDSDIDSNDNNNKNDNSSNAIKNSIDNHHAGFGMPSIAIAILLVPEPLKAGRTLAIPARKRRNETTPTAASKKLSSCITQVGRAVSELCRFQCSACTVTIRSLKPPAQYANKPSYPAVCPSSSWGSKEAKVGPVSVL